MRIAVSGGTGTVGHHVVDAARNAGHEVVVMSPAQGVDVRSGEGLADALRGTDVVVDVAALKTFDEGPASEFFVDVARSLQQTGAAQGVGHIVTLSIVGVDKTSFGYYRAKVAQERAAMDGPVPHTVMRATQLHELPAQIMALTRHGSQAEVFDVRVQTVAARTVGEVLVELAEGEPLGRAPDLAGPREADFVDLAREFARKYNSAITVLPNAELMTGIPPRALLPEDGARLAGPTFQEWLDSNDAAALPM